MNALELKNEAREAMRKYRRDSVDGAIAARMLFDHAGPAQRQTMQILDIGTNGGVGRQLRKLAEELPHDDRLRRRVATIKAECRGQPPSYRLSRRLTPFCSSFEVSLRNRLRVFPLRHN